LKFHLLISFVLFASYKLFSQAPANDDCNSAYELKISNAGYAYEKVIGTKSDISNASREIGELCSKTIEDVGNCDKTVWYKFYLPTTRNVGVKLTQQDSAIPQIFSGFSIYKIKGCGYVVSDLSEQLQPIAKFGISGNSCLNQGYYLIQVSAKSKSKGELWLELDISYPQSETYDSYQTYFDMSSDFSRRYFTSNLLLTCASIEYEESLVIRDSNYSKSVWFSYTVDDLANEQYFYLSGYSDINKIKYRVFIGNVNLDSIKSNKPFKELDGVAKLVENFCYVKSKVKLIVQVIAPNSVNSVRLEYSKSVLPKDLWSTPQTTEVFDLELNKVKQTNHSMTCEGELKTNSCKSVIGTQFRFKSRYKDALGNDVYDTFHYAGYVVINVKDYGLLSIYGDYNWRINSYMALYKGDIRNNCNVSKVGDTVVSYPQQFKNCVDPGVYTLIISTKDISYKYNVQLYYNLTLNIANIKYQYPKHPQIIPPYNPLLKQYYESDLVDFRNKDTILKVEDKTFKGVMNFREFEVTNTGEMDVELQGNSSGYLFLFKGSIKDGTAALIANIDYTRFYKKITYSSNHPVYKSCFYLPKGKYTAVSVIPSDYYKYYNIKPCEYLSSKLILKPLSICPLSNNVEPRNSIQLNDNLGVFDSKYATDAYNYQFTLEHCTDCQTTTFNKPLLSCSNQKYVNANTVYRFYTFYMEEAGSLYYAGRFELYKGNVKVNPNVVLDSNNIISPCKDGQIICNLEGGRVYTFVLFDEMSSGNNSFLKFAKHYKSVNDYAASAIDLDNAILGNVSSGEFLTCHTGRFKSDPSPYNSVYFQYDSLQIKFKDSLNYKRTLSEVGNIWYTFVADGNCKVNIDLIDNSNSGSLYGSVFRYKNAYEPNFNKVLSNGLDSTGQAMELVAYKYISTIQNIQFINQGCKSQRYFILIESRFNSNQNGFVRTVKIKLNASVISSTALADQCTDAQELKITVPGKFKLSADNTCHTYGGSAFEEKFEANVKTTWLKITTDNLTKFDLGIRNTKGTGVLKYVLYGGTCGAMTRIGQANDRYAYFTLSCMGKGEYFIQVYSTTSYSEIVEFEIEVSDGKNLVCKSYDFKNPLAQFKITGGCQSEDTVRMVNYSTNGEDIEYTWFLNGQVFSKVREPVFSRRKANLLDSNKIKLIVKNTFIDLFDSFEMVYRRDTQLYNFAIIGKRLYKCDEEVNLYVSTDYPYKINYTWISPYNSEIAYKSNYVGSYYQKLFVKGNSDNCNFIDSTPLEIIRSLNLYKDTEFCASKPYSIFNNDVYTITLSYNGDFVYIQPGESYNVKDTGDYSIFYYSGNCYYTDKFHVKIKPGPPLLTYNKDIYVCNKDSVHLEFNDHQLKNQYWSTGLAKDTFNQLTVFRSALYRLKGALNECTQVQSSYNVKMDYLDTNVLRDTVLCYNTYVDLKSPYPVQFSVLEQLPSELEMNVQKPFKRLIKLKRGLCEFTDTSFVSIFPRNGAAIDTFLCSQTHEFEMNLDARSAKSYNWFLTGASGRYFKAKKYGYYPVQRTDLNGCNDTIHFNVITNCEFVVYVPDVFTPNNDGLNESFGPSISGLYKSFSMQIFNRWGEMVFNTNSSQVWHADYMGDLVQQGVYSYLITVFDKNGKPYYFKGSLNVLR
jgi:gliding motility-associated-like protein